jgi:hypothetical protein
LKTRVELSFNCTARDVATRLGAVLSPDNEGAPGGLHLSMSAVEKRVTFQLGSDSPSTALSTVQAILRDASLFEQIWLLSRASDGKHPRRDRK